MVVTVEFFGIPRQRAGRAAWELSLPGCQDSVTLGAILETLARELPDFARDCLAENQLRPGYIANINGQRFVFDRDEEIFPGETLLILSADVGG
jgi:molybdopterin converting factor small subunit